jgi:hypothetical protein
MLSVLKLSPANGTYKNLTLEIKTNVSVSMLSVLQLLRMDGWMDGWTDSHRCISTWCGVVPSKVITTWKHRKSDTHWTCPPYPVAWLSNTAQCRGQVTFHPETWLLGTVSYRESIYRLSLGKDQSVNRVSPECISLSCHWNVRLSKWNHDKVKPVCLLLLIRTHTLTYWSYCKTI